MENATTYAASVVGAAELDLIDIDQVCAIIGGSKPVNRATVYRGIAAGKYPPPIKVGPNISRWLRSEWLSIIQLHIAEREGVLATGKAA